MDKIISPAVRTGHCPLTNSMPYALASRPVEAPASLPRADLHVARKKSVVCEEEDRPFSVMTGTRTNRGRMLRIRDLDLP
jgi:hypothetical protein